MSKPITLGGLPIEDWVDRQVRVHSKDRPGKSSSNGVIKQLIGGGKSVYIKIFKHTELQKVGLKDLQPWWSANPDLKEKADRLKEAANAASDQAEEPVESKPKKKEKSVSTEQLSMQANGNFAEIRERLKAELQRLDSIEYSFSAGDMRQHRDMIMGGMAQLETAIGEAEAALTQLDGVTAQIEKAVNQLGQWVSYPDD